MTIRKKMVLPMALAGAALVMMAVASLASATHVRPKGASPSAGLVRARVQPVHRTDPTHGPPLAAPSCVRRLRRRQPDSGSPDANGAPANIEGVREAEGVWGRRGPPETATWTITTTAVGRHVRGQLRTATRLRCTLRPDYAGAVTTTPAASRPRPRSGSPTTTTGPGPGDQPLVRSSTFRSRCRFLPRQARDGAPPCGSVLPPTQWPTSWFRVRSRPVSAASSRSASSWSTTVAKTPTARTSAHRQRTPCSCVRESSFPSHAVEALIERDWQRPGVGSPLPVFRYFGRSFLDPRRTISRRSP